MNQIDDDVADKLEQMFENTTDDFGVTLSSNKISEDVIDRLHNKIKAIHQSNVELLQQQAETNGEPTDGINQDPNICMKRLAV